MNQSHEKHTLFVDIGCCILCGVCVDLAPDNFYINDAGYIEIINHDTWKKDILQEVINNCPKDCIYWT